MKPLHQLIPALGLCLVCGAPDLWAQAPAARQSLGPEAIQFHCQQEPLRAGLAQAYLRSLRSGLGLGSQDDFQVARTFTNEFGEAIVRLDHRHEGYRVLGSGAIARVPMGGAIEPLTASVLPEVRVEGQPRLSEEQAVSIAVRHLNPKGFMTIAPQVERVVFPARCLGGPVTTFNPATGGQMPDRTRSVHARLAEPYVWAYEVRLTLKSPQDGLQGKTYHVDARTGSILRITDDVRHLSPVTGTGKGFYSGTVSLKTSRMNDGTYALYDTTRGTLPAPYLAETFQPDGSGWTPTGLQVWYDQHDATGATTWMTYLFQGNAQNTWGDGLPFTDWTNEGGINGQSAGVDAMYGMAQTWDFFKRVLGRTGLDGQGTSVYAEVLMTDPWYIDNASMYPRMGGIYLGAGSWPANSAGLQSTAELDVIAHEMTHAFNYSTARFYSLGEEAALEEGTADFFGQMVKTWARRPTGASSTRIPNTGADWVVGAGCNRGTPLRWLDKPSRDGRSVDAWFDGLYYMDGHFSSGVVSRALYFLAQGCSATPGEANYSAYLPQGMTGLGNDTAARIWYTTLSEFLYSGESGTVTLEMARKVAVFAAKYLYGNGWDCPESKAVENAFAAVNVGSAYGEGPRTRVAFTDYRNGDWIERHHFPDSQWGRKQYFPVGTEVWPRVSVTNTTNTEVAWSIGGPSVLNDGKGWGVPGFAQAGGVITEEGAWKTPYLIDWFAITATSKADPRQFAEGRAFLVNLDTDADGEQDAVDLGSIAFSWYLTQALSPAHSIYKSPKVDDEEVAGFVDAMRNAWWSGK